MFAKSGMRLLLLGAIFAIPLILTRFVPIEYSMVWLVGIPLYAIGFLMDVKSTIPFGIDTVKQCETSILFGNLCRMGFKRAIIAQGVIECSLAVVIIPILLSTFPDHSITGSALVSFGMIHMLGNHWNKRTSRYITK